MFTRRMVLGALGAATLLGSGSLALAQDKPYIALVSKGFQHQFWQAVKAGADKAATDLGVTVTFEGPDSETQVDRQIDMLGSGTRQEARGNRLRRARQPGGDPAPAAGEGRQHSRRRFRLRRRQRHSDRHRFDQQPRGGGARRRQDGRNDRR